MCVEYVRTTSIPPSRSFASPWLKDERTTRPPSSFSVPPLLLPAAMGIPKRFQRLMWMMPLIIGRLMMLCGTFLLMYETLKVVWEALDARRFGRGEEYIVWSSVALAAMAEQRMQTLLRVEAFIDKMCHKHTLRYATSGSYFHVGLFMQLNRFHKLLLNFDIDPYDSPYLWNQAFTVTIVVPIADEVYDWNNVYAYAGTAGLHLFRRGVFEIHYWVPTDRWTNEPLMTHGVIEMKSMCLRTLSSFREWCIAFTDGPRAPLARLAEVSLDIPSAPYGRDNRNNPFDEVRQGRVSESTHVDIDDENA